jgi:type IV pilus assembly protein PilE
MIHPSRINRQGRPTQRTVAPDAARGFTLIELMIVLAVIAVLSMIALPSFTDYVRKSRRSDAFAALTQIQQAQERWRANKPSYNADLTGAVADGGLGLAGTSASGYYSLALSDVGAAGYTVTATAVSGTSQAADSACQKIVLRWGGGNSFYTSADASDVVDTSGAKRCWNR